MSGILENDVIPSNILPKSPVWFLSRLILRTAGHWLNFESSLQSME
jgi:hypothetical protein